MTEYIDKKAVVNELNRVYDLSDMPSEFYNGYQFAVSIVRNFEKADVAPVHCKDCRYGEPVEDGLFLCHYSGMEWNGAEHFCSYGERRC